MHIYDAPLLFESPCGTVSALSPASPQLLSQSPAQVTRDPWKKGHVYLLNDRIIVTHLVPSHFHKAETEQHCIAELELRKATLIAASRGRTLIPHPIPKLIEEGATKSKVPLMVNTIDLASKDEKYLRKCTQSLKFSTPRSNSSN